MVYFGKSSLVLPSYLHSSTCGVNFLPPQGLEVQLEEQVRCRNAGAMGFATKLNFFQSLEMKEKLQKHEV